MATAEISTLSPAHQAERILAAWDAGDEPLLRKELHNSQHLRYAPELGWDEERLELLRAASQGILRAPIPLTETRPDPAVRRCLDLLAHLARTSAPLPRSN